MLARTLACTICATVALAACDDGVGPPRATPPTPPAGGNDPDFAVTGVDGWHVIGNALTPGSDALTLAVDSPDGTTAIDVWVDDGAGQQPAAGAGGHFDGMVGIGDLGPGEHQVLFAADGGHRVRARHVLPHPSHVFRGVDRLGLCRARPGRRSTPTTACAPPTPTSASRSSSAYTYTDPAVTDARKAEITTWLTSRRDQHDDEIALHIHPWCHFVATAGIPCITDQSTVYQTDTSGLHDQGGGLWAGRHGGAARRRRPDLRRARPGQAGHLPRRRLGRRRSRR